MIDAMLRMRWRWKAVRILFAALLVAVVANLLGSGTSRFSWGKDTGLPDMLAQSERRLPGKVVLSLRVDAQVLRVKYRVVVPRTTELFEAVQRGDAAQDPRGLLRLLGPMEVDGEPVRFRAPSVAADEGATSWGRIAMLAEPVTLRHRRTRVVVSSPVPNCCLPVPQVVVQGDGAQVVPRWPDPLAQSAKGTTFEGQDVAFDLLLDPFVPPRRGRSPSRSSAASSEPGPADRWSWLAGEPPYLAGSAVVRLRVAKQVLTAAYELTLGREQKFFAGIQRGEATDHTRELVQLLGQVEVNNKPLHFGPPSVSVEANQSLGRVTLRSERLPLAHPRPLIEVRAPTRPDCCLADRRVLVETQGAQVQALGDAPVAQSAERTVFVPPNRTLVFQLLLDPFDGDLAEREHVGTLLRRLNEHPLPVAGWMLYWAAMSIPLLLFLFWHRGHALDGSSGGLSVYVGVVEGLLVFLMVMLAGSALAETVVHVPLALWLARGLKHAKLWVWDRPDYHDVGGPLLIVLAAGLVWPLLAWQRSRVALNPTGIGQEHLDGPATPPTLSEPDADPARRRRLLRRLGASMLALAPLLAASLVVGGALLRIDKEHSYFAAPPDVAAWTLAAAVVLAVLLWWICRELGTTPPSWAMAAAVAVIVTVALLTNVDAELRYPQIVARVVVTVACFAMAASLLPVAVRTAQGTRQPDAPGPAVADTASPPGSVVPAEAPASGARTPAWLRSLGRAAEQAVTGTSFDPPGRRAARLARVGLAVLLLLLVVPNPRWSGRQFEVVNGWYARGLADWLIHAVYLTLGVIVVLCLRDLSPRAGQATTKSAVRYLCYLLLAMYVFDPSLRVFYVPVALAAGWFTLSWLLPRQQVELVDKVRGTVPPQELVQAAVADGRERRALRARRKELLTKVGTGEITRTRYRKELDAMMQPSTAARVGDRPARDVGMLLGPRESAWANGRLLAGYAFWLSVPWVLAVYLRQELSGTLQDREFLVLALLLPLVSNALQWPVIGFVFGYLYPYVRGNNGLWKGVSVAGTLIIPILLHNLAYGLIGANDTWPTFFYWALQAFVTCVSTGFLADLATLRTYGRGWDELTDVHNFSALAAWGSSVAAASAGGLVTLLSSTIGQFVSQYTAGGGTGPGP